MWTCDCDKNGKHRDYYRAFKETEVVEDGICVRCEHYAVWLDEIYGSLKTKNRTVFRKGDDKPYHFSNLDDLRAFMSVKYNNTPKEEEIKGILVAKKYMVVLGHKTKLTEKQNKRLNPPTIKAHNTTGDFIGEFKTKKEASKATGDSVYVVQASLNNHIINSKNGNIYTLKDNFDVESFLRYNSSGVSFDGGDFRTPSEYQYDLWEESTDIDLGSFISSNVYFED